MSSPAIQPLAQVQLGTSLTTIYTAPSQPPNIKVRVSMFCICNTDSSNRTVTIRKGTPTTTAANSLLEAAAIDAHKTYFLNDNVGVIMVLSAGQAFEGLSDSANKITVTVDGEIQYD